MNDAYELDPIDLDPEFSRQLDDAMEAQDRALGFIVQSARAKRFIADLDHAIALLTKVRDAVRMPERDWCN